MDALKKIMTALALGIGVTALAVPSFAQTTLGSAGQTYSRAEAGAVHDCSVSSRKEYANDTNETNQIIQYHACMGQHGRQE